MLFSKKANSARDKQASQEKIEIPKSEEEQRLEFIQNQLDYIHKEFFLWLLCEKDYTEDGWQECFQDMIQNDYSLICWYYSELCGIIKGKTIPPIKEIVFLKETIDSFKNNIISNGYKYSSKTAAIATETLNQLSRQINEPWAKTLKFRPPRIEEILCHGPQMTNTVMSTLDFDSLDGDEFEYWCADLLKGNGFIDVDVTKHSGDQGVDVIATKDEIKYAVQCKCQADNVGNSAVQEVCAGKFLYNCHVAIVMTNRYFTESAKELAKATGVLLWDRDKIIYMLNNCSH